ncbi:hypothetical protein BD414DRAFT_520712 [Trametes punicea]|nr:hypothetical protein BD414DRAFT_520712 [Trametes punicea]
MTAVGGPPWFAYKQDGSIHCSGVPERLKHYPPLEKRGIVLVDSHKPGVVFGTGTDDINYIVKVLDLETEELAIYERLLCHLDDPTNHIVPCEIDRSEHPLLIMPMLQPVFHIVSVYCKSERQLLRVFFELIEGLEYLHRLHIVHMDLCHGNLLTAMPWDAAAHVRIVPYRLYIIDFDSSRQLEFGPGKQHAITLPETQMEPPKGLTHFDPYSWDVYCLGRVLEFLAKDYCETRWRMPRIAQWYAKWLIGDERGCRTVCHCRPTARTARLILACIRLLGPLLDMYDILLTKFSMRRTA